MLGRAFYKNFATPILLAVAATIGFVSHAAAAETVKVALHWNAPNAAFIPYYVASKKGFYADAGLNVEISALPGSVLAVTSVGSGSADIGQAGSDAVLVGVSKGSPLKVVFLLYQKTPTGIIAPKKTGIEKIEDLKGKTISTAVASPEGILLRARLAAAGLDPDTDVKILNVAPGAKLSTMLAGESDTSTGFVNFQALQAESKGVEINFIPFATDEQPLYGHAVFANTNFLNEKPEVARRFLDATIKALVWARENPAEAVDLTVNWDTSIQVNRDFVMADWGVQTSDLIGSALTKENHVGYMEDAGWENLVSALREGGVIEGDVDISGLYTNDLIPDDAPKW